MGGVSYINKSFQKCIKYLFYLSKKKQNKTKKHPMGREEVETVWKGFTELTLKLGLKG